MIQLTNIQTSSSTLSLGINQKQVKLNKNCSLTIQVIDQGDQSTLYQTTVYPPFQRSVQVTGLPYSTLIRVRYTFINGGLTKTSNLFVFTTAEEQLESQPAAGSADYQKPELKVTGSLKVRNQSQPKAKLCSTEDLIRSVGKINNLMSGRELDRAILAARKSKNMEDFVKSGYKSLRPQLRQSRFKRTMLISHGMQVCDTIYKHSQGRGLFRNDWFMGPLYSFDRNAKEMQRKL